MMTLYKIISHKHEQDEVLEVRMYQNQNTNLPSYCEEQEVYLQDLDSDEKDKLIEDMMDQIDTLKGQIEYLMSTLTNLGIGG